MPDWSYLAPHLAGFGAYIGVLAVALRAARPTSDAASALDRLTRAAKLPWWAIGTSVLGLAYSAVGLDLISSVVWTVNLVVAAVFLRAMRRVRRIEAGRAAVQHETNQLWQQVRDRERERVRAMESTQQVIQESRHKINRLLGDNG